MNWKRIGDFYGILVIMKAVHGVTIKTQLVRSYGKGSPDNIKCASDAVHNSILAKKLDASNTCTNLDWGWGAAPNYESGSTYFEKKHVIETYETPLVHNVSMTLPISFKEGSYVDMYVELTRTDFSYAAIQLWDKLENEAGAITKMIVMEMRAETNGITHKSYSYSWRNFAYISPFPFSARTTYKITFKALSDQLQVLFAGYDVRIDIIVPPENARRLILPQVDIMLLHKIEFVGA